MIGKFWYKPENKEEILSILLNAENVDFCEFNDIKLALENISLSPKMKTYAGISRYFAKATSDELEATIYFLNKGEMDMIEEEYYELLGDSSQGNSFKGTKNW